MKSIYAFLSSKKAAWLFTIVAIACRITSILYASFISRDKIFLALQSKSWLMGKGFSIPQYFVTDLANPVYDLTPKWPPGYPILLAPFLKASDYNVATATTALDLIAGIILIFLTRALAVQLKFPAAAVNIITVIVGCFDYAFISEALPTDISSFAFFLGGLLLFLKSVQQETLPVNKIIVASFLLFIPCTFRYAYPPLSISVPVALILIGWYLGNKIFIKKGVLSLSIISLLLVLFFAALRITTGKTGYIVDTGRGFYPENLLHCAPVAPGSFINSFFLTSQLKNITGMSLSQCNGLLEIVNVLMIAGLLILLLYLFFYKRFFDQVDPFKLFLVTGFFIAAATFVSLGYLSVTYKPQPGWGNYLGEPRYFIFIYFYLQIAFIGWIFLYDAWKKSVLKKIIVSLFSLLLFIEVTHNLYFNTKVVLAPAKYDKAPYEESDYTYFTDKLDSLSSENPTTEFLIVAESDDFFPLMAAYLGHKGIHDGRNLVKQLPHIKKRTILLFTLYDNELAPYREFLAKHNGTLMNYVNGVSFYTVMITP